MKRYLSPLETMLYRHLPSRVTLTYRVSGRVEESLLADALSATTVRYPLLRARVSHDRNGSFLQLDDSRPRLRVLTDGANTLREELNTPRSSEPDVLRATLIRGDVCTIVLHMQHAFSDGRSILAVGEILWQAYTALAEGRPAQLPEEHQGGLPDPIEAHLGGWSDVEVADYVATQDALSRQITLASLPRTAGVQADPSAAPAVDAHRVQLSREDTANVLAAARAADLSVHGLISGVLLSGVRKYLVPTCGPVNVGCLSAVDLRSRLGLPIGPDRVGLAASWFTGIVRLTEDRGPFELGRDYQDQLRVGIDRGQPELALLAVSSISASKTILNASLSVSNLNAVSLPPTPAGVQVTDIRTFSVPDRDFEKPDNGRLRVLVLTVDGRLNLELAFDSNFFASAQVEEFLEAAGTMLRSIGADVPACTRADARSYPADPPSRPRWRRSQRDPFPPGEPRMSIRSGLEVTAMSDTALCVEIPPRYCPLPTATHPHADLLSDRGAGWLNGFGLCRSQDQLERMRGNDCAGFYGRIMPTAQADRLQLAVDWCYLMFAFDDIHCDEGPASTRAGEFVALASKVVRVLETPDAEMGVRSSIQDAFLPPVRDLALRGRALGTNTQVRRIIDGHRAWFFGVLWEFGYRAQDRTPALNDYAHMRQHTAGGTATTGWMEIVDGAEIPDREMDSPAVRALAELAFAIASWDDDLFSYGKELWFASRTPTSAGCKLNLVDILARERDYVLEEALWEAVQLCNRLTYRFIELRDQVWPKASAPLRDYLDHLTHLLRGNIEWGLKAGRYRNPDGRSPNAVTTSGSWTEIPPAGVATAPPIPSIAWWWDDDLGL